MEDQKPIIVMKCAKELAFKGEDPPASYIVKDGSIEPATDTSMQIPIIDLAILMSSSSSKDRKDEMEKLRSALSSWGVFQAIGHGIPYILLDKVRSVAKEFFDLPMEEKKRVSKIGEGGVEDLEGYGPDNFTKDHVLEWVDRLLLLVKPQDRQNLNYWPQKPDNFRKVLQDYSTMSNMAVDTILKVMAELLGLEESYFTNKVDLREVAYTRFNCYPPCSRPDLVYGLKAHSDSGGITILLQDKEVEGLQVLKDGRWIKVPTIPQALLVNVGDEMEIISNGIFKSTVHRVITNSEKERLSVAVFYMLQSDEEIGPTTELIDQTRPRLYKTVNLQNYLQMAYNNYLQGTRAIDLVKV